MLLFQGFFQNERKTKRYAGELNGEAGATKDIKIRQLSHFLLHFQEATQLCMQSEDTSAAG